MSEKVLCISADKVNHLPRLLNVDHPFFSSEICKITNKDNVFFKEREEVENDQMIKQIIPYVLFRCYDEFFTYRRGKQGSEQRLHSMRSLGLGGHVKNTDLIRNCKNISIYRYGLLRELMEEITLPDFHHEKIVGIINDNSDDVGKVHLGIVYIYDVKVKEIIPKESCIANPEWCKRHELFMKVDDFESWSQICIENLLL